MATGNDVGAMRGVALDAGETNANFKAPSVGGEEVAVSTWWYGCGTNKSHSDQKRQDCCCCSKAEDSVEMMKAEVQGGAEKDMQGNDAG